MGETFTTEIQARYRDINLAGHVDNVEAMRRETRRVAEGVAAAHGCTAEVEFEVQYPVTVNDAELGTLDMREWVETIQAADERVNETMGAGLYELIDERDLLVTSTFDDGPDCLTITGAWQGTDVPDLLAGRLADLRDEVAVEQQVRLRVLRRGQLSA